MFLEYIKNIGRRNTRGGPPASNKGGARPLPPGRAPRPCGPPGRPPAPIFGYMVCFDLEKIRRKLSGRSATVSRWNLAEPTQGSDGAVLLGKHPSGRRKSNPSSSQTILSSRGVNLHQHLHQHHLLSSPRSSLVFNSCL